jgi:protein-S-isoprenylcysteine O-methyltransferase Ste14
MEEVMAKKMGMGFRWRTAVGLVLLVTIATTLISRPLAPDNTLLHVALDVVGFGLYLAGLWVRVWATLYVGGRKGRALVTEGPYSVCRNPLYVGSFLLACASASFIQSWVYAVVILGLSAIYIMRTVPREERQLRDGHGEDFVRYCRTVPRFLPRFSLFRTSPEIAVTVKGLGIESRRLFPWLWIPVLGKLIALARGLPWIPQCF